MVPSNEPPSSAISRPCEMRQIWLKEKRMRAQAQAMANRQPRNDQAATMTGRLGPARAAVPETGPDGLTLASMPFQLAPPHADTSCGAGVGSCISSKAGGTVTLAKVFHLAPRSQRTPSKLVAGMKLRPHHLLLNFLDFLKIDYRDKRAVFEVIKNRSLRNAVKSDSVNFGSEQFFWLLRSQGACYWEIDTVEDATKKIAARLRGQQTNVSHLAREIGVSRSSIQKLEANMKIRMATLIAIGRPAGFLNGVFSLRPPDAPHRSRR
ncbi:MAG: hypothetical protein H6713_28230 [Myxococcales bacterium]|nr:hypothetical protein [Myxococcales bacterium]